MHQEDGEDEERERERATTLAKFWPPCQGRSQTGSPARVCFTWGTMQWASLWPSSVIKTGVSLAAQSVLFCHPLRPSPFAPWLPTFSARFAFVCPLGLPVTASFTRSFALLLHHLFLLCFVGSGRPSSATRATSSLSPPLLNSPFTCASLRASSTLRFRPHPPRYRADKGARVYLNLFPVFLI